MNKPLLLALALALLGCPPKAPPPTQSGRLPQPPPPAATDPVVAQVNGVPITAAQVQTQATAQGTSAKEALEALVRAELLAQEADQKGLVSSKEVQEAAKQERVRRLLQDRFEKEVTPENTVEEPLLRRLYERNKPRLVHGDIRELKQILVAASPDKRKEAEALAREIQPRAEKAKTPEEFVQVAAEFQERAKAAGVNVAAEHGFTDLAGMTVREFANAAFAIKNIGGVSPVVGTRFGFHIIYYLRLIPAENISYEQARAKLLEGVWPEQRGRAFAKWETELAKEHRIQRFAERLKSVGEGEGER